MTQEIFTINNLWVMIAALLVFIMHLGFASLESGLTRSKNTVNILFKNTIIPAMGLLTYALVGFNLMYPGEAFAGGFFGFAGFGLSLPEGFGIEVFARDPHAPTLAELWELERAFPQERYLRELHFSVTANAFTTRAVIERVGTFNADLKSGGDREFGERVWAAGLPLVYEAVHAGMSVRGYDVNQGVVDGLNGGVSHIDDLSDEQVACELQGEMVVLSLAANQFGPRLIRP